MGPPPDPYFLGIPLCSLGIFFYFILMGQNLEKTRFWEVKMAPKIEFSKLWRALVSDLSFSSFFFDFVALGLGTFVKGF